ncbi:MAG TPA: secondary thiamine-phosphate synthase enzyme YjbQ [Vicinamibacterales bacterium]|jgi:secondary thiamine-phosphate synthase enzyme|nr:secondary thiamine-phosphate synthase enzyme YjbQ [Vicinamibacterales bacterium]
METLLLRPTRTPRRPGRHTPRIRPVGHTKLRVTTTCHTEFVDITDHLRVLVRDADISIGFINVQSLHTTTAIVVNEHEPLLLTDFEALLESTAPADAGYRHDDPSVRIVNVLDDERVNGHAHCRALLLGPSACINVIDGALQLGQWQRVFLVELDGPRAREISVVILGESGR